MIKNLITVSINKMQQLRYKHSEKGWILNCLNCDPRLILGPKSGSMFNFEIYRENV